MIACSATAPRKQVLGLQGSDQPRARREHSSSVGPVGLPRVSMAGSSSSGRSRPRQQNCRDNVQEVSTSRRTLATSGFGGMAQRRRGYKGPVETATGRRLWSGGGGGGGGGGGDAGGGAVLQWANGGGLELLRGSGDPAVKVQKPKGHSPTEGCGPRGRLAAPRNQWTHLQKTADVHKLDARNRRRAWQVPTSGGGVTVPWSPHPWLPRTAEWVASKNLQGSRPTPLRQPVKACGALRRAMPPHHDASPAQPLLLPQLTPSAPVSKNGLRLH